MSETDLLYARLRENYEHGTLDDPLLRRAFEDAQPNRELAASLELLQARLSASEEQVRAAEDHRLADAESHLQALQALRSEHSREIHARDLRISELKKPKPRPRAGVRYEPGESEMLGEMGWSKRAGD